MKSKTKTILIFAAILAAVFLIAFLDGGAVQSAADEEEEGMLIGAFVSEKDLDIGGDLAVSAAGKFVWKAGRLYMETDDWSALGERGGVLELLYVVDFDHACANRNRLRITVREQ